MTLQEGALIFNLTQLKQHCRAQSSDAVYLLAGDDLCAQKAAYRLLWEQACRCGYTQRERWDMDTPQDRQRLGNHTENASLFQEKTWREIHVKKPYLSAFKQYLLAHPPLPAGGDVLRVFIAPFLAKKDLTAAWIKPILSQGKVIFLASPARYAFASWLKMTLNQAQITLSEEAFLCVNTLVQGNTIAVYQLIEKLCLLHPASPPQPMEKVHILPLLAEQGHFDVFSLVDAALDGHLPDGLRILHRLRVQQIDPILITWSLVQPIKQIHTLCLGLQSAASPSLKSLMAKEKVWISRQSRIQRILTLNAHPCVWGQLLLQCSVLDQINKGAKSGNAWVALGQILWRFTRLTVNRPAAKAG